MQDLSSRPGIKPRGEFPVLFLLLVIFIFSFIFVSLAWDLLIFFFFKRPEFCFFAFSLLLLSLFFHLKKSFYDYDEDMVSVGILNVPYMLEKPVCLLSPGLGVEC